MALLKHTECTGMAEGPCLAEQNGPLLATECHVLRLGGNCTESNCVSSNSCLQGPCEGAPIWKQGVCRYN